LKECVSGRLASSKGVWFEGKERLLATTQN
jgi:hypothetical protein